MSTKEETIEFLNTTPSIRVFQELFDRNPTNEEVDLIIVFIQSLTFPVVNTLLSYISLMGRGKFSAAYFKKIAIHWEHLSLKTVEEAMEAARLHRASYKKGGKQNV